MSPVRIRPRSDLVQKQTRENPTPYRWVQNTHLHKKGTPWVSALPHQRRGAGQLATKQRKSHALNHTFGHPWGSKARRCSLDAARHRSSTPTARCSPSRRLPPPPTESSLLRCSFNEKTLAQSVGCGIINRGRWIPQSLNGSEKSHSTLPVATVPVS